MNTLLTRFITIVASVAVTSALHAQQPNVAGTWTLFALGEQLTLVITQEGSTLTGQVDTPHGSTVDLTGSVTAGELRLSGWSDAPPHHIELSLTGTVRADGTLAGTLTSNVGDGKWTATRVKDK